MDRSLFGHGPDRTTSHWRNPFARWLRGLLFWMAIGLPVLYVPLLAAGPDTTTRIAVLLVLLALHTASLVASHSYRPD